MLARWLEAKVDLSTEHEARGRVVTLIELHDLPFEAMAMFYSEEEKEDGA